MMRVAAEWPGHDFLKLGFDLVDRLTRSEAGAIADAEHVRVDGERLLAKRGIHHDVGSLAPNARQFLQQFARTWHLAAVLLDQRLA